MTNSESCTVWLQFIEFHGFTSRINSKGYHSLVPGLISIFLEMVWVPLRLHVHMKTQKLMVNAHFQDATTIKFGEKSMTTLKTLFHVSRAKKTRTLTYSDTSAELFEARVGLTKLFLQLLNKL